MVGGRDGLCAQGRAGVWGGWMTGLCVVGAA